jgi:glycosyltransferase involved in cell wall biosynthesis
MTIVMVIDLVDNKTNGSVMTVVRFAEGLRARGHEVRLVAIGAEGEHDCPVEERYVPILTEVSAKNQVKFGKFDEEKIAKTFEGADIIHFIFPFKLEKQCKALADKMGIPTTAAFHVQPENISYNIHMGKIKPVNDFIYSYFKKYYNKFDRIHCPSSFIANQLSNHGYKGELYVISNGYDPAFVPPATQHERCGKFEIVMTGRLAPEKNQQVLIKAIALSAHRDEIHLTLLGNGPKKAYLAALAEKEGVDISFDFLKKDDLIKRLQNSDLYVHAATVEIEAIAAIEAIACGLVPIISNSKLSATPQFAIDERSLFTDNDEYSLAQKIDYWYEHDDERRIMGAVYANFATNFSLEKSLEKAENMFRDEINSYNGTYNDSSEQYNELKQSQHKGSNIAAAVSQN